MAGSAALTEEGEIVGVLLPNISTTVALVLGLAAMRRVPRCSTTRRARSDARACVAAGVKTVITSRRFVQVARLDAAVKALVTLRIVYLEELRGSFGCATSSG